MYRTIRILAALLAALIATSSAADTLRLRDGRVFEGTVVERGKRTIVFDAVISNIATRMTFRSHEIESITTGEIEVEKPSQRPSKEAPSTTKPAPPALSQADQGRYLMVPITGTFGEQVGPTGVASVFDYAQRRDIRHIVFHIDSPGGYVWAANEISEIMASRPNSITCYAVVDHAISAAIWVAFGCDTIILRSGGTIGGAVAYTQESSTGAVEVDAKMNSIFAAKLAGLCAKNGHPEAIAHAMVVMEESLYAIKDDSGSFTLSNHGGDHDLQLDDDTTVLTLTGKQAEKYGVATIFDGEISELGALLGIEGWSLASDFGSAAMKRGERALKKRQALYADLNIMTTRLNAQINRIALTDPNAVTYTVHEGGAMTSFAIRTWRERTDLCLDACRDVSASISEIESLGRKAGRIGIDDFLSGTTDLAVLKDSVRQRMSDLKKHRNKTTF